MRAVAIVLAIATALAVLSALIFVTNAALDLKTRLDQLPGLVVAAYFAGLGVLGLAGGWLVWRMLGGQAAKPPRVRPKLTREDVDAELAAAEIRGTDIEAARRELAILAERQSTGRLQIALFGDVSVGKSSLVNALLPGADAQVRVTAGTTREAVDYAWRSPGGFDITLTDLPGTGDPDNQADLAALEEARRAHIVLYVCDSDLDRDQHEAVRRLADLDKPLLVALNKADRYDEGERALLRGRLAERLAAIDPVPAMAIVSAGHVREIAIVADDGSERTESRQSIADVDDLRHAMETMLGADPETLHALHEAAVIQLAAEKLSDAEILRRREIADGIVASYTRKAVIGALAAVSPGTDLIIQGYLGTGLVRELCDTYGITVRDVDVETFLDLSRGHAGKALPIMLAVAGNGFKAFPGIGTVAGGLLHAAAYGMIFDALGRGLVRSLAAQRNFHPASAFENFKEQLGDDVDARAGRVAKLVLASRQQAAND
jgi:small GTP-binding protein